LYVFVVKLCNTKYAAILIDLLHIVTVTVFYRICDKRTWT